MWRHRVTGKAYVGLTIDEPRRVWQHVAASKNGKAAAGTFQHAIAADGIDAFEFTILEDNIPGPQLPDRERFWIAKMGTLKPAGYNQNRGGVIGGFGGIIVIDGVTYLGYGRLAEAVGLPLGTIMGRIRMGWTVAEAAGLHERTPKTRCRIQMNLAGEELRFQTVAAACRYLGLSRALVSRYKHKTKQSWETAITTIFCQGILDSMEKFAIFPTYGRRRNLAA
jgi:hypothetical protein